MKVSPTSLHILGLQLLVARDIASHQTSWEGWWVATPVVLFHWRSSTWQYIVLRPSLHTDIESASICCRVVDNHAATITLSLTMAASDCLSLACSRYCRVGFASLWGADAPSKVSNLFASYSWVNVGRASSLCFNYLLHCLAYTWR